MKTKKPKTHAKKTKKKFNKKGGAGWFSWFSNTGTENQNTETEKPAIKTTTTNVVKSNNKNIGRNLLQSAKDIGSSGKYLFSLVANPSNTHRMLFKNAHFIDFISFKYVKMLYCSKENPDCIKLENGYLFSNNPNVINTAEQAVANDKKEIQEIANATNPDPSVPPDEAVAIKKLVVANENASETAEESDAPQRSLFDQTFQRLAFAKLNDAILTDNLQLSDDPKNNIYISFEHNELFSFFHTYKYQVNRCLWYGGWGEWSYIVLQVNNMFVSNQELANAFLDELWGTVGLLKVLSKYPKEKRDKLIETIKSGKEDAEAQKADATGTQMAEDRQKELDKEYQAEEAKQEPQQTPPTPQQTPPTAQSRFSRFTSTVKNSVNTVKKGVNTVKKSVSSAGEYLSSKMGKNFAKYRVYRKLLKYYDIDAGKYNMNLLKKTGVLKSNYPLFMVREAKIAVQMAINNLEANRNAEITNVDTSIKDTEPSDSLDKLIDDLMKFNMDNQGTQNLQQVGGKKKNNKTRRLKMSGGSRLFFTNVAVVFKQSYNVMVNNQIKNIVDLIKKDPTTKTKYVAKFFAEIIKCLAMMTISLCLTLANYLLYPLPIPVSMPHCVISNLMYMWVIFKMRIINMDKVNVIEKMSSKSPKQIEGPPEPPEPQPTVEPSQETQEPTPETKL
jgi:hypothetical protein